MMQADTSTRDLVKSEANRATLNQLVAKYNQLYKTYLQQVQDETNKRNKRNYPYNIKNPNEVKNTLTPATPFPSNGTEDACFKSCVDTANCAYALYSNSGCGIDCNPNKCLLYGANADGIVPVDELPTNLPTCPAAAGDADAWCKTFNHPATNAIIPALVLRLGKTDWRTLAMQMPKSMANAADAPFSVDLTTNVQTWGPDAQFSDVNYAPDNEISLQFRFFAEYWLNAYDIMSGSAPVMAGQGMVGTFAFSKLSSTNAPAAPYYNIVSKSGMWSGEGPNEYTCKNEPTRNATGNNGDYDRYCIFDKESDAQKYCSSDPKCKGYISNQSQDMFTITANPVSNPPANGGFHEILRPKEGSMSYVGTFGGQNLFWNSAEPSTGGTAAGLKTAAALAATTSESAKFNYNYSAFENPVWKVDERMNAMSGQVPPQLAGMSIPSWQFLGVQDSAQACQRAATDDPSHVYTLATYYNASYNNPKNGNSVFARACYGHVAGAPTNTVSSSTEDNVQTMTPPHGFTKLGGEMGINILKKMYELNQQIVALTDTLKISQGPGPGPSNKEGFAQQGENGANGANDDADDDDDELTKLTKQLEVDATKLNEKIQFQNKLEGDSRNAEQVLLYSRIKFGVAVVLGLFLVYLAYKFLTAAELPATIENELSSGDATSSTGLNNSNSNYDLE